MALQFVLGGSGSGKSRDTYQRIIADSLKHPEQRYIILVPEQFSLQTQKTLVSMHPRKGLLNIDILSFNRLAYRVFAETGGAKRPVLEETGKTLVLQKIAQEQKKNLKLFASSIQKPGCISQVKSQISEFMQYQVDDGRLTELQRDGAVSPLLACKLADMELLYREFRAYLKKRYLTSEEVLDVLCGVIGEAKSLRGSILVLDGFTGFTPIQYKVLQELLRICRSVIVTVTIDGREDPYEKHGWHRLFAMSSQTVTTLTALAKQNGVSVEKPVTLTGEGKRFAAAPALAFLERHLFRYHRDVYGQKPQEIRIRASANPREELSWAARQIHALVRKNGWHYRDFAIITGDLNTYANYAGEVFGGLGIPYFLDRKHSIVLNPFVEYLRSAVDAAVQNFSYESVFRYLRCGMSDLSPEETDELENYVIALGIRGYSSWKERWVRIYPGMEEERIEEINGFRSRVLEELSVFTEEQRDRDMTVEERTRSLYAFMVRGRAQEKVSLRRRECEQVQDAAGAREYDQIYGIVIELMDKLVEILGDEKITLANYQQLLEAGFSEAQVGIIPPGAEQVVIGDTERTRLKDIRVLFCIGVNEGMIPKPQSAAGIFSENDRDFLESRSLPMAPSPRVNLYIQRFYLYLNLTKPSHLLYLSYSKTSAAGDTLAPSYLIGTIRKLFPLLEIEDGEQESFEERLEAAEHDIPLLISGLRDAVQGKADKERDAAWRELYSWFWNRAEYRPLLDSLLRAAFFENPQDQISRSVARALYGTELTNSATRLERFAACAFAHFLQYGMQLAERSRYEFSAVDMGKIIHEALEHFSDSLSKRRLELRDLSDELRETIIDESIEEIIHDYGNTILHSTSRSAYMIRRIRRILRRTVWALQEQVKKGDFVPGGFEVSFAMEDRLEAINIQLDDETKMKLRGRIDRVDLCETEDKVYVKVIDYKSGSTSLDLIALYHGLQLQLVIYLNAAVELEQKRRPDKQVEPAGIFYYNIKDPVVDAGEDEDQDDIIKKILQQLKMNGLSRSESEVITLMDRGLREGESSSVIPVAYNKNGSLSRYSSAAGREQFSVLQGFVRKKAAEIGRRIMSGEAGASPSLLGNQDACAYCPYAAVCGFDERLPGYGHRRLAQMAKDEIWEAFAGEGGAQ